MPKGVIELLKVVNIKQGKGQWLVRPHCLIHFPTQRFIKITLPEIFTEFYQSSDQDGDELEEVQDEQ